MENIKIDYSKVGPNIRALREAFGETLETFLKGVKKLKRSAIRTNIGSCIAALGVVAPTIMVALRLLDKDNKEFQTKKDIEAKLAAAQN